jgi:hypothetical protein
MSLAYVYFEDAPGRVRRDRCQATKRAQFNAKKAQAE